MAEFPYLEMQVKNITDETKYLVEHSPHPYSSIWSLVKDRMHDIVSQATQQANSHLAVSADVLQRLRDRVETLLGDSLKNVAYRLPHGNISVEKEVNQDVELAVDEAMHEMHINDTNSTFRSDLVRTLDLDVSMESFNHVLKNSTDELVKQQDDDFFHKMPLKDETLFVALVCMGIIVPIIFITLAVIFLYKRRKGNKERRQEMLLRDQPEFSMDDCNARDHEDEDIPDLDLRNLRV